MIWMAQSRPMYSFQLRLCKCAQVFLPFVSSFQIFLLEHFIKGRQTRILRLFTSGDVYSNCRDVCVEKISRKPNFHSPSCTVQLATLATRLSPTQLSKVTLRYAIRVRQGNAVHCSYTPAVAKLRHTYNIFILFRLHAYQTGHVYSN